MKETIKEYLVDLFSLDLVSVKKPLREENIIEDILALVGKIGGSEEVDELVECVETSDEVEQGEKSTREWFESIEDEVIREKALRNIDKAFPLFKTSVDSLAEALSLGFSWSDNPEGFRFWHNYYKSLKKDETK